MVLKIRLWSCKIAINYLLSPFFILVFHFYKIIFFPFFSSYNHVYPKYCERYKKDGNQWTQRLSLKTIINELRKKEVIISMKILKRKDLLLLATKLTEERPGPRNDKGTLSTICKKERYKISKRVKNNDSATKSSWKLKHFWYLICFYWTSKNFT